jgi:hypothetical protein
MAIQLHFIDSFVRLDSVPSRVDFGTGAEALPAPFLKGVTGRFPKHIVEQVCGKVKGILSLFKGDEGNPSPEEKWQPGPGLPPAQESEDPDSRGRPPVADSLRMTKEKR